MTTEKCPKCGSMTLDYTYTTDLYDIYECVDEIGCGYREERPIAFYRLNRDEKLNILNNKLNFILKKLSEGK